jgi:ferritin-like metal-binding protein YciE
MSADIKAQLIKQLTDSHAMEKQALRLLDAGSSMIGDEEIARILRAHRMQTGEHERMIARRLEAYGEDPSRLKDAAMQAGALGIGIVAGAAPDTPVRLATVAFAFEHFEIANYGIVRRLAEKAGDTETVAVADRILEEEEAAAELLEGTFDRILELALGEPARSPLPGVTPIGKPSERESEPYQRGGPQDFKDKSADASLGQPEHVDSPTEGDHLTAPEPGHPVGQTQPYGGEVPDAEHPESVGATTPNEDRA